MSAVATDVRGSGAALALRGVNKSFARGKAPATTVLRDLELDVQPGESLAIVGPSGSGKSTLLALLAGLDTPTSGQVLLDGIDLSSLSESALAALRLQKIGLVFQAHHLLPQCTALENVLLPTLASASTARASASARDRALLLLQRVGLAERADFRPASLSGGECQRVALARALVHEPRLILADEPTGSLDAALATEMGDLLLALNRESGATLVVVTHASTLAWRMQRVLELREGRLSPAQGARQPVGNEPR